MNASTKCKQLSPAPIVEQNKNTCTCHKPFTASFVETSIAQNKKNSTNNLLKNVANIALGIGIVFFPKCPLCWIAYMSLFSAIGLEISISYQPWVLPILIALLVINLGVLYYKAKKGGSYGPIWCSMLGVLLIIVSKLWLNSQSALFIGLLLISTGALWNAMPKSVFVHLKINHLLENKFRSV